MSLKSRVTLATVLMLSIGLAIVGVTLNTVLAHRQDVDAATVAKNRAAALLVTLDTRGRRLRVHEGADDAVLDEQAWVFDRTGKLIEAPPTHDAADGQARALARVRTPTSRDVGRPLRSAHATASTLRGGPKSPVRSGPSILIASVY